MSRLVNCLLLVAGALGAMHAQQFDKQKLMGPNPKSPPKETSVTINGKTIEIVYHAPSVRGRKIFGGSDTLQPNGTVWRLGADFATVLHTTADLDLNGLRIPAGNYSLYIDLDQGNWKLIVNKQTMQWGVNQDESTTRKESEDVGVTALKMKKPSSLVETLKITLSSAGGNKGNLQIQWENMDASAPFTVR